MDVPENPTARPAELDLYFHTESLLAGVDSFVCTIRIRHAAVLWFSLYFLLSMEVDAAMLMLACGFVDGKRYVWMLRIRHCT